MINNARKAKKEKDEMTTDEIKEEKKLSMKEMMAKAKADKAEASKTKDVDKEENIAYVLTKEEQAETKEYFDGIK